MSKEIEISIIICSSSSNRKQILSRNIKSLKNQSFTRRYEVIIVIDQNIQLYLHLNKEYGKDSLIRVYENEGKGLTDGRNTGIKKSSGNIVVFLDDDAIPSKMWLKRIFNNYSNKNVIAVGGLTLPKWITNDYKWFPKELYWIIACTYQGYPMTRSIVRNLMGCNMSYRRDVFKKIGLFTPILGRTGNQLITADETEYCIRLSAKEPKAQIIFEPNAKIVHLVPPNRTTIKYVMKRAYYEGKSKALIRIIHTHANIKLNFSNESSYLKNLVKTSIPSFIGRILTFKNVKLNTRALGFLITAMIFTVFGYIFGNFDIRLKHSTQK